MCKRFLVLALILCIAGSAYAALDFIPPGGIGNWVDGFNWAGGSPPGWEDEPGLGVGTSTCNVNDGDDGIGKAMLGPGWNGYVTLNVTGTGTVTMKGDAAGYAYNLAYENNTTGILNVRDYGQVIGQTKSIRVGRLGNAMVNLYDSGVIDVYGAMIIGDNGHIHFYGEASRLILRDIDQTTEISGWIDSGKITGTGVQTWTDNGDTFVGIPAGWLIGWDRQEKITVSNPGTALNDYQVFISFDEADTENLIFIGQMQADYDDVRFTEDDGTTLLSYWIEPGEGFWVKISTIAAGDTIVYLYHGNTSASGVSNGEDTFILYDDFNDNSIDPVKWSEVQDGVAHAYERNQRMEIEGDGSSRAYLKSNNIISGSYVLEYDGMKQDNLEVAMHWDGNISGLFDETYNGYYIAYESWSNPKRFHMRKYIDGDITDLSGYTMDDLDTFWHKYKIILNAGEISLFYDGTQIIHSVDPDTSFISGYLGLTGRESSGVSSIYDDVRVRKYASPEPVVNNNPPNAPQNLSFEDASNPSLPKFSWTFDDPDSGDTQSAYQVQVAASSSDLAFGPYMWDSGKTISPDSSATYNGSTLGSSTTYYWKVRTWDYYPSVGDYCSDQTFTTEAFAPPDAPTNPLCDGVTNPSNLENFMPVFSWTYNDPGPADTQEAHQVLVASDPSYLASGPYMWDSGKVYSSVASSAYDGIDLEKNTTYYWKVRTWNYYSEGNYCGTQSFSTADLDIPATLPGSSLRKEICLNGTWDFQSLAGGAWTTIRVPGAYPGGGGVWWPPNVEASNGYTWDRSGDDVWGYPSNWEQRGGNYEYNFFVPSEMSGMVIRFRCEGALFESITKINGATVGSSIEGYLPFEYDVTSQITTGSTNDVRVEISDNDGFPGGHCVAERGIWRDTYLRAYPKLFVENDIFIKTSVKDERMTCEIPVSNKDSSSRTFFIRNYITDATGQVVKKIDGGVKTLSAGNSSTYTVESTWTDPHLWFLHDPYLYHIHTVLYELNGTPIDWKTTRFGFREFIWTEGPYVTLNGRKLFYHATGGHYEGDGTATKEYAVAHIRALKEIGIDLIRCHARPYPEVYFEAGDEEGMLFECESAIYASWSPNCPDNSSEKQIHTDHIRKMVKTNRNHPSIFNWSVANEIMRCQSESIIKGYIADWIQECHNLDPTRPAISNEDNWNVVPQPPDAITCDLVPLHYCWADLYRWEDWDTNIPAVAHEEGPASSTEMNYASAGYEVRCQDIAAWWTFDGNQLYSVLNSFHDATISNGARVTGFIVNWDFNWRAFRHQPTNKNQVLNIDWPDLTLPGTKPKFIKPSSRTTNIWDSDLPVMEFNPNSYKSEALLKQVRFSDNLNRTNYYEDDEISRTSRLYYDDLRLVNHLKCDIERRETEEVLTSNDLSTFSIEPGEMRDPVETSWITPSVNTITPVNIVRQFYYDSEPGYKHIVKGKIFPRFDSGDVPQLSGKSLAIYDPAGNTKTVFDSMGISYTSVSDLVMVSYSSYDILVLGESNSTSGLSEDYAGSGGVVICLKQDSTPDLPINMPSLSGGGTSARFLLNGERHYIVHNLGQEDFHYWTNDLYDSYSNPVDNLNYNIILTGDKDGTTTPLFQVRAGNGMYIFCQFNIVDRMDEEPVAGQLLVNMLQYAGNYLPHGLGVAGLIANDTNLKNYFDSIGLVYVDLDTADLGSLDRYKVVIIEGGSTSIASEVTNGTNGPLITQYVKDGGKVILLSLTDSTVGTFNGLIPHDIYLSSPYLGEVDICVKAAVSWTRADTPKDLIQYYSDGLIPQPFHPNLDPLLTGISNIDLYWDGTDVFSKGVKVTGMDIVAPSSDINVLVTNWKIDTSNPGTGEYPNEGRDKRRADWFTNRDPVVIKLADESGYYLISQLNILQGGDKGKRVITQFLSEMECAIPPLQADFDGHGDVGMEDLKSLIEEWLQDTGSLTADIAPEPPDGVVNLLDFAKFARYWLEDYD